MAKKNVVEFPELEEGTIAAKITKNADGNLIVTDLDGNVCGTITKTIEEGRTWALPKNPANRKWVSVALVERELAEKDEILLGYRHGKVFGPGYYSNSLAGVNKKLLAYLSDEEKAEVEGIIARAMEARAVEIEAAKAAKNDPIAKIQAKIAALQAKLDEMEVNE